MDRMQLITLAQRVSAEFGLRGRWFSHDASLNLLAGMLGRRDGWSWTRSSAGCATSGRMR
jgi:hypothetical protein